MLRIMLYWGFTMEILQEYHVDALHRNRYATFLCDDREIYINQNFDTLLLLLGKYYFHRPDLGINGVCSLIKDEINKEWNLNGLRKKFQLKRVTTNQIKSIRRSFRKVGNSAQKFVRIPFNVASIFFFILMLVARIENDTSECVSLIRMLDNQTIGNCLYNYYITIFEEKSLARINALTNENLKQKYRTLEAHLCGYNAFMKKKYSDLRWGDTTFVIK